MEYMLISRLWCSETLFLFKSLLSVLIFKTLVLLSLYNVYATSIKRYHVLQHAQDYCRVQKVKHS